MGKIYSEDLRAGVVRALDGGMSKMHAHRTFGVSRSTIDDWLALRAATGGVRPVARRRCGPARALGATFESFVRRHQGATLKQMAMAWERETGQKLSINTFSLALKRLGWTRKKRVFSTPSGMRPNGASFSPL